MPIKTVIEKSKKYKFNGYFDIKELYSFFQDTIKNMGYKVKDKEYEETTGAKKEIKSKYEAELPLNDYYQVVLKYKINVSGKPITIEDGDNKISTFEGTAELAIEGVLVQDFQNKLSGSVVADFLNQIYNKYISKKETEDAEGRVKEDVGEAIRRFKQFLNAST